MTQPPPSPLHTLRIHQQPALAVSVSSDNERIYSGDAKGRVVITSTRFLRAVADWEAHKDGLLGVEEFSNRVITSVSFHWPDMKLIGTSPSCCKSWQRQQDSRLAASDGVGAHPTGRGGFFGGPTSTSAVLLLGHQCAQLLSVLSSSEFASEFGWRGDSAHRCPESCRVSSSRLC